MHLVTKDGFGGLHPVDLTAICFDALRKYSTSYSATRFTLEGVLATSGQRMMVLMV
jgi:hypothetical protein